MHCISVSLAAGMRASIAAAVSAWFFIFWLFLLPCLGWVFFVLWEVFGAWGFFVWVFGVVFLLFWFFVSLVWCVFVGFFVVYFWLVGLF